MSDKGERCNTQSYCVVNEGKRHHMSPPPCSILDRRGISGQKATPHRRIVLWMKQKCHIPHTMDSRPMKTRLKKVTKDNRATPQRYSIVLLMKRKDITYHHHRANVLDPRRSSRTKRKRGNNTHQPAQLHIAIVTNH